MLFQLNHELPLSTTITSIHSFFQSVLEIQVYVLLQQQVLQVASHHPQQKLDSRRVHHKQELKMFGVVEDDQAVLKYIPVFHRAVVLCGVVILSQDIAEPQPYEGVIALKQDAKMQ